MQKIRGKGAPKTITKTVKVIVARGGIKDEKHINIINNLEKKRIIQK